MSYIPAILPPLVDLVFAHQPGNHTILDFHPHLMPDGKEDLKRGIDLFVYFSLGARIQIVLSIFIIRGSLLWLVLSVLGAFHPNQEGNFPPRFRVPGNELVPESVYFHQVSKPLLFNFRVVYIIQPLQMGRSRRGSAFILV